MKSHSKYSIPEIENILQTMTIIVDTREQPSARAEQRYKSFNVPYTRQKLEYGDYTYNFEINGEPHFPTNHFILPDVMIERKKDLEELSQCFCRDRKRFEAEFQRAKQQNASIYLLIEDGNMEKLMHGRYKTKFNSKSFLGSLVSWSIRFNIKIFFIQHEISGQLIKEILYKELKERLEGGFYD